MVTSYLSPTLFIYLDDCLLSCLSLIYIFNEVFV